MKRIILGLMLLSSTSLFAEGYQVNLQSAKQAGMAHTGAALKLGAESMHFNPAGLVHMEGKMDFSVGGSGVFATAKYNDGKGYNAETNNPMGTPFFMYAGFSIIEDKLAAGVSLTTPFGNSLDWGNDWKGAKTVQNISLESFRVQPTISYQIIEGLSIGVGLDITWGSFELSKALMFADDVPHPSFTQYSGQAVASTSLSGNADVKFGFNIGAMYDISDKLTVGLTYRSKVMMNVAEGDVNVSFLNETASTILSPNPSIQALSQSKFQGELPLPSNTTLGISYKPIPKLLLAFDLQYTNWEAYEELNINFSNPAIPAENIEKNYKSSFAYRLGAQYEVSEKFDIRAGVYYDQTPVQDNFYNPETPGANKTGATVGLSYEPCKNLFIDFAFTYINGAKVNGSYTYPISEQQTATFAGEYKTHAFMPSIGVSYSF